METKEGKRQPLHNFRLDPGHLAASIKLLLIKTQADNLQGSGIEAVLSTSLYAIVGAVALERGGEVANKLAQDKILAPLGFVFES